MKFVTLDNVENTKTGFERVSLLLEEARGSSSKNIELHMQGNWFSASMSPALYVVLKQVQRTHNVYLHPRRPQKVERILTKNGFFPHLLGSPPSVDTHDTTIRFKPFGPGLEEEFDGYVQTHVTGHRSFPNGSGPFKQDISRNLVELYVNATLHAEAEHDITVCGQLFPNRNRLEVCIADSGIGIHGAVRRLEPAIKDEEAILWAMQNGHTTRKHKDGIPGGLGLKQLKDFIQQNGGRFIMVSGRGYYELNGNGEKAEAMTCSFPGTAAYVVIRTDDLCYYNSSNGAPDENDIF